MGTTPGFLRLADLRGGARILRRHPGFAAVAVLTLALGIGATTALFSVVYGVLIKPLPYPEADALVSLRFTAPGLDANEHGMAPSMYHTYRDENRSFEHVGLWASGGQTLTGQGEPEQLAALLIAHGTFEALRVQPLRGRLFSEAEYTPAAQGDPVILSYAFWQRRFGGDESILGRTLTLDSRPWQVVGIMPADFRFLNLRPQPDVISPVRTDRNRMTFGGTLNLPINLGNLGFSAFARLKEGVTLAEANADVSRMLPIWLDAWPPPPGLSRDAVANWRVAPALRSLKDDIVRGVAGMLWVLMGTVGTVLLIACANIANLLLARADARRQELAVRAALGAGRWRIARALLSESLVLGVVGGVAGLALAYAAVKLLAVLAPVNLPRLEEIRALSPLVLIFAVTATLVSSLLFGSISAVKQVFISDAPLVGGARGASAGRERHRARNALIVVQVALAVVLLVGAGLMIRTFLALSSVEPGFDPENVLVARISIPPAVMRGAEQYGRVQRDILERIEALPGVTAAGFSSGVPMEFRNVDGAIFVEDRPYAVGESPPSRRFKFISPGYLDALGTRLIAGRDITWADVEQGGTVALVSENLARELWSEPQAAIGKRIRDADVSGTWREVVGVTRDVHEDVLYEQPPRIVYWPAIMRDFSGAATYGRPGITYAIRSERAGSATLMNEVGQAVWASNPNLPLFQVRTMRDLYAATLARTSFALVILAIAGAMALCLSVVGIYGVISYTVSQRTREIGIRCALGARPSAVQRMIVLDGLAVATIGVVVGVAAAAAFGRWMGSLLFDVRPLDLVTYAAVLGTLLVAVVLAAYVPARRAANFDPAATLRAE